MKKLVILCALVVNSGLVAAHNGATNDVWKPVSSYITGYRPELKFSIENYYKTAAQNCIDNAQHNDDIADRIAQTLKNAVEMAFETGRDLGSSFAVDQSIFRIIADKAIQFKLGYCCVGTALTFFLIYGVWSFGSDAITRFNKKDKNR
jgi:hypothetical protein